VRRFAKFIGSSQHRRVDMAQIARLAGALLAHSQGKYYLVGSTKGPCNFADSGFDAPREPMDAMKRPIIELKAIAPVPLEPTVLSVGLEGSALLQLLVERLLVESDASVSDRLWNLIIGESDAPGELEAEWFVQMPKRVWDAVRDSVQE
jgi:hypothetical protein